MKELISFRIPLVQEFSSCSEVGSGLRFWLRGCRHLKSWLGLEGPILGQLTLVSVGLVLNVEVLVPHPVNLSLRLIMYLYHMASIRLSDPRVQDRNYNTFMANSWTDSVLRLSYLLRSTAIFYVTWTLGARIIGDHLGRSWPYQVIPGQLTSACW